MENLSFGHVPDFGKILKWLSNIPHPQYSIFVKGERTDALMLGKVSYFGERKVPPANVLNLFSVCHLMFFLLNIPLWGIIYCCKWCVFMELVLPESVGPPIIHELHMHWLH